MASFSFDAKAFGSKGPHHVVAAPTAGRHCTVAAFNDEGSATEDAEERNARASELAVSTRYEVRHVAEGEAVYS